MSYRNFHTYSVVKLGTKIEAMPYNKVQFRIAKEGAQKSRRCPVVKVKISCDFRVGNFVMLMYLSR